MAWYSETAYCKSSWPSNKKTKGLLQVPDKGFFKHKREEYLGEK